jgi:hypothetical protein
MREQPGLMASIAWTFGAAPLSMHPAIVSSSVGF